MSEAVFKVLVTGGPMGGKSTVMEAVKEIVSPRIVPEMATRLFGAGISLPMTAADTLQFQKGLLPLQLREQQMAVAMAMRTGVRLVMFDRGILDSVAYLDGGFEHSLETTLSILGMTLEEAYAEYDMVIHLQTVAAYKPELFGPMGNQFRFETDIDKVLQIDKSIQRAYHGHPEWHFVPADLGIEGVVDRVTGLVLEVVRSECERKWVLPAAIEPQTLLEVVSVQDLSQFYMVIAPGFEQRYRKVQMKEEPTQFLHTTKLGKGRDRYEREAEVPRREYEAALGCRNGGVVLKTRTNCLDQEGGILSFDLFEDGSMTIEREFFGQKRAEAYTLPAVLVEAGAVEVTGETEYSNAHRALVLA